MADTNAEAKRGDEFTILSCIDEPTGLFLVRRNLDGEKLLGRVGTWAATEPLGELMALGAGEPVFELLNHENLVSLAGTIQVTNDGDGQDGDDKEILLWDFCDGGTLDTLFREPPVLATARGFLPESLCWHVLRGLVGALAWLHDGYRRDWVTTAVHRHRPAGAGAAGGGEVVLGRRALHEWVADSDWMPVVHRAVRAENVFFQLPRGAETYGACKLGDFSRCFVSGHVNGLSRGVVAADASSDFVGFDVLKQRVTVADVYSLPKDERPYTRGSDLFSVGALLFRMMTGRPAPDPEECDACGCRHMDNQPAAPCRHECHPAVDLNDPFAAQHDYTFALRDFVRDLLCMNRADTHSAAELMTPLETAFQTWRTGTIEGRAFVEVADDVRDRDARVIDAMRREVKESQG